MKFQILYNKQVFTCEVEEGSIGKVYPVGEKEYVYAAYCYTDKGVDMWVYSYNEEFSLIDKAEICGKKGSLRNAKNYFGKPSSFSERIAVYKHNWLMFYQRVKRNMKKHCGSGAFLFRKRGQL